MKNLACLAGTGTVGDVTVALGHVAPGNNVGKMTTGNFTLNSGSSSLDIQLNGAVAEVGYDQIIANGGVNLTNPTLNVSLGFSGAVSNQYIMISNDSADPVNGTFKNLPEGANFSVNGVHFQIT